MKIASCLLRGIEGAGVSTYVRQAHNWMVKHNIENDIFVLDDKKWPRANAQVFPEYTKINQKNINNISDVLNNYEYVFIHSVASIKHSQWAIDGCLQLIKDIKTKKIVFQNDHKIASIHRNANFFEICNLCDGIVSHSIMSPFYKKLVEQFGSDIRSKFIQLQVGFDFSQLLKYRKENHIKKITYLGRYATFKAPETLFAFLPYAKQNNILLEIKGLERSLGALNIFYDNIEKKVPKHDIIEVNKKAIENGLIIDNDKRDFEHIYVFGPYDYIDGMETLSSSLIGADFYRLDKDCYGDNLEYCQCEIISLGVIPMFSYNWAENCYIWEKGKRTNKRFVDLVTYGLFVKKDLSNVAEIVEKINEIDSNKSLKKRYLDCSFEVTRNHCDSEFIFQNLIDNVLKIEKAKLTKTKALF